jgi:hypothetical protein
MLNAKEYVAYFNEAAKNDGYADDELPFAPGVDDTINTDWQESVLQTAPVYDLSLGMTGGSDRISYFVSGSFFNQKGILVGSQYRRANVRANLDFSPSSKLSVRTSIGLGREGNFRNENDNTIDGVATNALANQPNVRVRNSDGTFTSTDDGLEYTNPVALGVLDNAESRTLRAMGNSELSYAFTDRLRLNGRVGVDMLNLRDLRWNSPLIIGTYAASARGVAQQGNTTVSRYVAETYLQWDAPGQRFGQLSLVGGSGVEYNSRENDFLQGEGLRQHAVPLPGQRRQGDVVRRRAHRQQPRIVLLAGHLVAQGPLLRQRQRPHGRFVALRRQQPLRPLLLRLHRLGAVRRGLAVGHQEGG